MFCLTLYLTETHLSNFANIADPDQAVLARAARSGSTLFVNGIMIRFDPTLENLTSDLFVLCTNVKVYLYNYSNNYSMYEKAQFN